MQRSKQTDFQYAVVNDGICREGMAGENPRNKLLKLLLSIVKTLQALYCMAKASKVACYRQLGWYREDLFVPNRDGEFIFYLILLHGRNKHGKVRTE